MPSQPAGTFDPLLELQKNIFSRGFFLEILALCTVSIQEEFQIKSVQKIQRTLASKLRSH